MNNFKRKTVIIVVKLIEKVILSIVKRGQTSYPHKKLITVKNYNFNKKRERKFNFLLDPLFTTDKITWINKKHVV